MEALENAKPQLVFRESRVNKTDTGIHVVDTRKSKVVMRPIVTQERAACFMEDIPATVRA
jgi:hypothetical protein